jgi:hypothetical protein
VKQDRLYLCKKEKEERRKQLYLYVCVCVSSFPPSHPLCLLLLIPL